MTEDQAQAAQRAQQEAQGAQQAPASGGQRMIAGRYALHSELGRGGMGIVWRAEDTVIGRPVAVKELRLPDAGEGAEVFAERVLREVRTGGRLNDPAVVTVFDVVSDGKTTYIVMELVEAPTLSDLVKQRGPLTPQQAASVGEQLLSALSAAHQAGIVHRDVKPGNIMVAPNGRVKLTDFGIAQAMDDPRLTTSGFLVGSPAFMSPERVAGREASPASDIWSLGVTLFFAVEGKLAFERGSTAATLHAIMNEVPYLTHAQGPLAAAIMGMLITTPEARISAQQATELLSIARAGTGMGTPPGGTPTAQYAGGYPQTLVRSAPNIPRPGGLSPGKRKAAIIGAAVLGVLLLVGGAFIGSWLASPSGDDARLETYTYGPGGDIPDVADSSYPCVNARITKGDSITDTQWVDCEKVHYAEVYDGEIAMHSEYSDSDAVWANPPDEDALARFAEARCALTFASNAIKEELRDELEFRAVVPSEELWNERPDDGSEPNRHIFCVLSKADNGQLTGSAVVTIK